MKNQIIAYAAFAILTALWLAFGAALLFNQELVATAWQAFRAWPLIGQLLVALVSLPVVLGLWIWNTAWPLLLRLVLVLTLACATLYTFFPKKVSSPSTPAPARP